MDSNENKRLLTYGKKLKNETSQAEAVRKKLRIGKADNAETAMEKMKKAKLKEQGRKRAYSERAVSAEFRKRISEAGGDDNTAADTVNAGSRCAEEGIYSIKAKAGKNAGGKGYGKKMHAKRLKKEKTPPENKKLRRKRDIQKRINKKKITAGAKGSGNASKCVIAKVKESAGQLAAAVKGFVQSHPLALILGGIVILVVILAAAVVTMCSMVAGGSNETVMATSFTAHDDDIASAERKYKSLESALQDQINRIPTDYPGYNEYNYNLAEIQHDPYELAALLTVLYEDYTAAEVREMLNTIREHQYKLTVTGRVEVRTRTETRWHWVTKTRDDGSTYLAYETYQVQVQYNYYILNTTLTNGGIRAAMNALGLTEAQKQRFELLLATKGNKPDIFGGSSDTPGAPAGYDDYEIPAEYLTDERFANIINEAKKYLGYPYVWGGSDPETSFDCSGFVSYVINNCGMGWSYGRLSANGWKSVTTEVNESDVKPGDLIFFKGTYSTSGASHVGIVVDPANKVMIHCGNPIRYASYDTSYWRAHLYCFGRIG